MTEWRTIPSFSDYEASDAGQIRRREPGKRQKAVRPLALTKEKSGYLKARLWVDGRGVSAWAHILVCEAFRGPRPTPKHDAAHGPLSRRRADNRASNLRWATRAENEADKIEDALTNRGSRNGRAFLTEAKVRAIRERAARLPRSSGQVRFRKGAIQSLVEKYGVTVGCLWAIIARRTWRHVA